MSRDISNPSLRNSAPIGTALAIRSCLVWLLATAALALTWWQSIPLLTPPLPALTSATDVEVMIVRLCAVALLTSTGWIWAVTTSTVFAILRGTPRSDGTLRRFILLACGLAVAVGSISPANASPGNATPAQTLTADTGSALHGLTMPDRAVGATPAATAAYSASRPPHSHVVRTGESLWSIAEGQRWPGTRWQQIWSMNRAVIGGDPNLIRPGQRLRMPPANATGSDPASQDPKEQRR